MYYVANRFDSDAACTEFQLGTGRKHSCTIIAIGEVAKNRRRERKIRAAVVVAERQGYYGSGGMGGGGGLQATDLRRRLESRCSGSTLPQSPRFLRHDGKACDQEERVDLQATLASGQPTCTGSRPCRRQVDRRREENGHEKRVRRSNGGGGGLLGSLYGKLRLSVGRFLGNKAAEEGEERGNGRRHRLRWCRRDFRWIADAATRTLLLGIVLFVTPG
ncbi:PREDICTED: uncharacterized protein LOC107192772 [Dufourea novaeangliae]|uniref:uncharacterized protein LOC107192772 n=1 Tax=Dufourea novaeangliae TaxID=178035 RepID=UPI0007675773|nr:PREDICTED: uncharacterized protein LOC107192772 [Dufourea novaeangliae]